MSSSIIDILMDRRKYEKSRSEGYTGTVWQDFADQSNYAVMVIDELLEEIKNDL